MFSVVSEDILLYEEKDVKYDVSLTVSDDEKYIFINTGSSTTDEVYIINDSQIIPRIVAVAFLVLLTLQSQGKNKFGPPIKLKK